MTVNGGDESGHSAHVAFTVQLCFYEYFTDDCWSLASFFCEFIAINSNYDDKGNGFDCCESVPEAFEEGHVRCLDHLIDHSINQKDQSTLKALT